jgi:apolipoprotein N-acyltransferase
VTGFRGASALVFAVVFVGIGIALIVETAILGGGVGYVIGLLFVAAGAGRFYVTWRRRSLPPG